MTTDNAKPAVITAAEFVAGGYAAKVANGECVVRDASDDEGVLVDVELSPEGAAYPYTGHWQELIYITIDADDELSVEWLPVAASSTDADEVARLRAEVARLRDGLEEIAYITRMYDRQQLEKRHPVIVNTITYETLDKVLKTARAALETGEAQS